MFQEEEEEEEVLFCQTKALEARISVRFNYSWRGRQSPIVLDG